ncbi:hypothetical protein cypCar_00013068 [Cyprinus carpio]|nr:hypothetical protein cypCar_00013068 [Cyprinus carpio]
MIPGSLRGVLDVSNTTWALSEHSVLQPMWDYLQQNHESTLRSPLFPVIISVSMYLVLVFFYTVLDLLAPTWPSIRRFQIHQDRTVTWSNIGSTLALTTYNHLLYILRPARAIAQWLWRPARGRWGAPAGSRIVPRGAHAHRLPAGNRGLHRGVRLPVLLVAPAASPCRLALPHFPRAPPPVSPNLQPGYTIPVRLGALQRGLLDHRGSFAPPVPLSHHLGIHAVQHLGVH